MMHVDISALEQAAAGYRSAAAAASSIHRDYGAASAYLATGLDGDTARRADEKISATERALIDAESTFHSAARVVQTLSEALADIKSRFDIANRSLSTERSNLGITERKLAAELDEVEVSRLKKKVKRHKSEIKMYEGQLRDLEDEAKAASKRASGELADLTGWADAARSAAFYKTPLGKGLRFGKGFVVDGVIGTLDGLEDLTIRWLYDHKGAMDSWKALGSFFVAVTTVAGGQVWWYHVVGGDRTYDEFIQDQYDIFFGGLKVAVHWDEFGEDPWRAAGAAGWDVATLLAGVGASKLARLQEAGKLSAGGRAALGVLKTVETIDDPIGAARPGLLRYLNDGSDSLRWSRGRVPDLDAPPLRSGDLKWDLQPRVYTLEDHFRLHPGYATPGEYYRAAKDFAINPPSDRLIREGPGGRLYMYSPSENKLLVVGQDGIIRSFYEPSFRDDVTNPRGHGFPTHMDYFESLGSADLE